MSSVRIPDVNMYGAPWRTTEDDDGLVHFMTLAPKYYPPFSVNTDLPGSTACFMQFFFSEPKPVGKEEYFVMHKTADKVVSCVVCLAHI